LPLTLAVGLFLSHNIRAKHLTHYCQLICCQCKGNFLINHNKVTETIQLYNIRGIQIFNPCDPVIRVLNCH
jgi:hypothetical protein